MARAAEGGEDVHVGSVNQGRLKMCLIGYWNVMQPL